MSKKIQFVDGTVFYVKNGKRKAISTIEELFKEYSKCCGGYDCCRKGFISTDLGTGERVIEYVLNGVKVVKTLADFDENGA